MANTPSRRKPASRSAKSSPNPKTAGRRPKKAKIQEKEITPISLEKTGGQLKKFGDKLSEAADTGMHDALNTAREQLRNLGDRLHEATGKGVHAVKEIAEEVRHFANGATELTKLRIEIHHLKNERHKLLALMGEKLRNLHRAQRVTSIQSKFTHDFKKLDELEEIISEKEERALKVSSDIKAIK